MHCRDCGSCWQLGGGMDRAREVHWAAKKKCMDPLGCRRQAGVQTDVFAHLPWLLETPCRARSSLSPLSPTFWVLLAVVSEGSRLISHGTKRVAVRLALHAGKQWSQQPPKISISLHFCTAVPNRSLPTKCEQGVVHSTARRFF